MQPSPVSLVFFYIDIGILKYELSIATEYIFVLL